MRVISGVAAAFFAWCCSLQLNDPDPVLWVALYGWAGCVSAAAASGRRPLLAAGAGFVVYTCGVLWLAPFMKPGWWHSEEGREGMGLLIGASWMLILCVTLYRTPPGEESRGSDRAIPA